MASRFFVRVAIALIAAQALAATTAAAAPDSAGTVRTSALPDSRLAEVAVAQYAQAFNVDKETAAQRLGEQYRVFDLPGTLWRRVGDALSSVEYDNDSGRWEVSVTTEAAREIATTYLDSVDLGTAVVRRGGASFSATERATARVSEEVRQQGWADVVGIGAEGDEVVVLVADGAKHETVEELGRALERTAGSTGLRTVAGVTPLEPASLACTRPYCNTLVGGARWDAPAAGVPRCSHGFVTSDGVGNYSVLSAGHCLTDPAGSNWYNCNPGGSCPGTAAGTQGPRVVGFNGDWGLLYSGSYGMPGPWGLRGGTVMWFDPPSVSWAHQPISSAFYRNTSAPANGNAPVGMYVCRSGYVHVTDCGQITYNNLYVIYPSLGGITVSNMILVDGACSIPGDSGGTGIGIWGEAVGLVSGSNATHLGGGAYACDPLPATALEPVGRPIAANSLYLVFG